MKNCVSVFIVQVKPVLGAAKDCPKIPFLPLSSDSHTLLSCYKLIQLFRVTCFFAGQYNTGYYGTFTDVI